MNRDRFPIAIGGAPRSGTTLVLRLLEAHSEIAAIYESQILSRLIDWLEGPILDPYDPESAWNFRLNEYFAREEIRRSFGLAIDDLFGRFAARQGKRIWVEKTPRNAIQAPELFELFPELRFLHVVRDGRDVAVSMPKLRDAPKSIAECARLWKGYVRCGRAACRLRPGRSLELRYEDLVSRPAEVMGRVAAFLGIEFEPAMADLDSVKVSLFAENWGAGASPSAPVGRWRREPEFPRDDFKREAGALLVELGYETSPDW